MCANLPRSGSARNTSHVLQLLRAKRKGKALHLIVLDVAGGGEVRIFEQLATSVSQTFRIGSPSGLDSSCLLSASMSNRIAVSHRLFVEEM